VFSNELQAGAEVDSDGMSFYDTLSRHDDFKCEQNNAGDPANGCSTLLILL
jgi:hypothetical protein